MSCHNVFASFCATAFLLFCAFLPAEVQGERGKRGRNKAKIFFSKEKRKNEQKAIIG
jgi:hypothetical protein